MKSKIQGTNEKYVYVKSYSDFLLVERAMKIINQYKSSDLQISIIGLFNKESSDNEEKLVIVKDTIEARCKKLFEFPADFGIFLNPEIGNIFISGFLVNTFLQKVEKRTIGSMSTGPYGILRGLGIDSERTTFYLKSLQLGNYLLILRGFKNELNLLTGNL